MSLRVGQRGLQFYKLQVTEEVAIFSWGCQKGSKNAILWHYASPRKEIAALILMSYIDPNSHANHMITQIKDA